jgi:hypothetical protein
VHENQSIMARILALCLFVTASKAVRNQISVEVSPSSKRLKHVGVLPTVDAGTRHEAGWLAERVGFWSKTLGLRQI